MTNSESDQTAPSWSPGAATIFALAIVLLIYPAFRMAVAYFDLFSADAMGGNWWELWSVILIGHWLCAGFVCAAIASERGGFSSIGLDVGFFVRRRWPLLLIIVAALLIAYFAPGYFYGDELPERMRSHPLGPVSASQRVFWVGMAITAGVTEELLYRGYALTRLRRLVGLPLAFILSVAGFALMHGPSAFIPEFLALYVVSGVIFAGLFLWFKMRRLELFIVGHAALDLLLVASP